MACLHQSGPCLRIGMESHHEQRKCGNHRLRSGSRRFASPGWICGSTGGGVPQWTVETDSTAPSKLQVLRQSGIVPFPWCAEGFVTDRWHAGSQVSSSCGPQGPGGQFSARSNSGISPRILRLVPNRTVSRSSRSPGYRYHRDSASSDALGGQHFHPAHWHSEWRMRVTRGE